MKLNKEETFERFDISSKKKREKGLTWTGWNDSENVSSIRK